MKDERFIIQGLKNSDDIVYWNMDNGWQDMDTATRYGPEILFFPPALLPLETASIVELDDNGNVINCYVRGQTPPIGDELI